MGIRDAFTALFRSAPPVIGPGAPAVVNTGSHPFLRGLGEYDAGRSLGQPYVQSPWVMRAIKHIVEPIASVPLRFALPGSNGPKVVADPDLDSFWRRPALGPEGLYTLPETIRATIIRKKLDGHVFWVLDDTWLLGSNTPANVRTPFLIIPAGQMRPIFDGPACGVVKGWWFRDKSGRDWPLLPEQVLHPRYFNPYDETGGASEYGAVRVAAEGDSFAGQFIRSLMQGNGDRGPIISPKDSTRVFTDAQRLQMEAALQEKRRANMEGKFRPLFLGASVEVTDPAIASPDSEFMAQRSLNKAEIFAGLGVPPSMAEAKAKYSTGAQSDRYILIEDTCKPEAADLAGHIATIAMRSKGMTGKGGDELLAFFDWDGHSVMQEVREARIGVAKELFAMGVPMANIDKLLSLGLGKFNGSDTGFLPFNLQTVADALAAKPGQEDVPDKVKEGDKAPADDPAAKLIRLLSADAPGSLEFTLRQATVRAVEVPPPVPALPAPEQKAEGNPATAKLWRAAMIRRAPMEKATKKVASRLLMTARAEVLSKLAPGTKTKDATGEEDGGEPDARRPEDVLFDLQKFETALTTGLDRISKVHMQAAADFTRADFGVDDAWTMAPQQVLHALESRRNLIADCAQGVFDDVKASLAEGFQAGETTRELADRVRSVFNGFDDSRALTIAITETGAAYGAGSQAGALSAGAQSKMWLSARDSHVRPTHKEADGQTVPVEGYFSVGGELCQHPCAEGLSAKEACNCRCDVAYRVAPVEGAA